jgi:hypothetical protein
MRWLRYFFGTPQRFIGTVFGLAVLYALINPNHVKSAVNVAFGTLFGPIATIVILFLVLRMIFGGRRR